MKHPQHFKRVHSISIFCICLITVGFSLIVCFTYGTRWDAHTFKGETDNKYIQSRYFEEVDLFKTDIPLYRRIQVGHVLMLLSILGAILMQAFVSVNLVWFHYFQPKYAGDPNEVAYEYLTRFGTILFVWSMPLTIPDVKLFCKVISVFYIPILGVMFPALVHICLKYPRGYGRFYWHLIVDVVLILLALFIFFICTMSFLQKLGEGRNFDLEG